MKEIFSVLHLIFAAEETLPTSVNKAGYDFAGWYTEKNGQGTKITSESDVTITSNITLYAKFTEKTYKVKYDGNNATSGIKYLP